MKREELMIGDWVIRRGVPEEPMRLYDMKATADIAYLYQDGRCVAEKFENIEPIPLTSDILEKNSFLKVEAIKYPNNSVGLSFLYRDTSEGLRIFVQNACFGVPTSTMIKTCKYVHEVQHMIKMCNTERAFVL